MTETRPTCHSLIGRQPGISDDTRHMLDRREAFYSPLNAQHGGSMVASCISVESSAVVRSAPGGGGGDTFFFFWPLHERPQGSVVTVPARRGCPRHVMCEAAYSSQTRYNTLPVASSPPREKPPQLRSFLARGTSI